MRIEAGAATDIGKVRDGNEDAYLMEHPLYVVADGMGGARGGEVASRMAVGSIEDSFDPEGTGASAGLAELVRRANDAVFDRSSHDREVAGMGTTLTAVVVDGSELHLAHVGDSRAYLLRAGDLRRLTDDHTLVARMVKAGEITPAEADVHPHRNVLIRVVGTEPDVDVDESVVALLDGDRVLLCTDGLTGMVTEQQMQAILETEPDPRKAADRLVRAANRAGGIDNITVIVLDAHESDEGGGDLGGRGGSAPRAQPSHASLRAAAASYGSAARRWALRAGVVVVVAGALLVGVRFYVDRQWYVGDRSGHVAVFQGVPATVGGFHFSRVAVEFRDLSSASVRQDPLWADLEGGITANSREDALAIVAQMRAEGQSGASQGPTVSPSASPLPSPSPSRSKSRPAGGSGT